jgi:hypothetical protein
LTSATESLEKKMFFALCRQVNQRNFQERVVNFGELKAITKMKIEKIIPYFKLVIILMLLTSCKAALIF